MADYTGTILELKEKHAVVMTDACDFVMIKKQSGMSSGQQVRFQKSDLYTQRKNPVKYLALAASVFVVLFSYAFYHQFSKPETVYAYVDIDINPSIELAVGKNAQVLDVKPLNKDAQALLENLKITDLPVKQAVLEVVKESERLGFIRPDKKNAVLVSASIAVDGNVSEEKVLDNILSDIGSSIFELDYGKIKPEVIKVTPEDRSLSIKNKISMGRYALYKRIKQGNAEATIEEAKTARVSDMLEKAQINNSNDIGSGTENGGDMQNNDNASSDDNKDEAIQSDGGNSDNNNTLEGKKSTDTKKVIKNKSRIGINTKNTGENDNNTSQNTTVEQNVNEGDTTSQSTTVDQNVNEGGSTSQNTTPDKTGNADENTNADTKPNENSSTDQSTTVHAGNTQDNTGLDGASSTPEVNQEPVNQDVPATPE